MHDLAQKPATTARQLLDFLAQIDRQPTWRVSADLAADYYDGYQTPPDVKDKLQQRGQPDFVHNLIAPAIDGVCGLEAKTRTAVQVVADRDDDTKTAEALSQKLSQAWRMTRADRAVSDAYKASLTAGLGWVEVSRSDDVLRYDYNVQYVHRNEIFWDWHSQNPDLSDARWLLRHRPLDVDQLKLVFPQHSDVIDSLRGSWASAEFNIENVLLQSPDFSGDIDLCQSAKAQLDQWIDIAGQKIRVYELYYRHYERRTMLKLQDGRVIQYDKKNPYQAALIVSGQAKLLPNAPLRKMRMSYFIGPFRVADMDSVHPHDHFPYVPFWGHREDRTRAPYGPVRRMIPAQDEINLRRRKLTGLLNKVLVIKDRDAVEGMSDETLVDELYKQDSVITLNPNRLNKTGPGVAVEFGNASLSDQQFRVMTEAKQSIQDTGGVYSAFLGQDSNATSGIAINSLVEQGTVTLAEINDNMRFSKQLVGELLLAHIVQDIGKEPHEVALHADDKSRKTEYIVLNNPQVEDGRVIQIDNAVQLARLRVIVADAATAPGYRQQMATGMMNMISGLPPKFQEALIPMLIDMSDLPNRHEAIRAIKEAAGAVDPAEMTPEQLQAQEAEAQEIAKVKALELKRLEVEIDKLMGEAQALNSKNVLTEADAAKRAAEAREIEARVKKIVAETVVIRQSLAQAIRSELGQYENPQAQGGSKAD